jgi:hypothetical protein
MHTRRDTLASISATAAFAADVFAEPVHRWQTRGGRESGKFKGGVRPITVLPRTSLVVAGSCCCRRQMCRSEAPRRRTGGHSRLCR